MSFTSAVTVTDSLRTESELMRISIASLPPAWSKIERLTP